MHVLRAGNLAAGLHGPERIDEKVAPVFVAVQRHIVHPLRPQQHALRPDVERARLRLQLVPRIDVGRLGQAQLLAVRAVLPAAGVDLVRAERHQLCPGSARRTRHRHGQLHVGPARALRVALAVAYVGYRRRVDYRCGRQLLHIGRDVLRVALAQQSGRAGDRIGYHLHRPRADEAARAGNKYWSCIHIIRSSETYSACVLRCLPILYHARARASSAVRAARRFSRAAGLMRRRARPALKRYRSALRARGADSRPARAGTGSSPGPQRRARSHSR